MTRPDPYQYLNSRRRVEYALPAAIMYICRADALRLNYPGWHIDPLRNTAPEGARPTPEEVRPMWLLYDASWRPLDGIDPRQFETTRRRMDRYARRMAQDHMGSTADKQFIMMVRFLQMLIEQDKLRLIDGSPLAMAFDLLTVMTLGSMSTRSAAENDRIETSATKAARKMLSALQKEGFYK